MIQYLHLIYIPSISQSKILMAIGLILNSYVLSGYLSYPISLEILILIQLKISSCLLKTLKTLIYNHLLQYV